MEFYDEVKVHSFNSLVKDDPFMKCLHYNYSLIHYSILKFNLQIFGLDILSNANLTDPYHFKLHSSERFRDPDKWEWQVPSALPQDSAYPGARQHRGPGEAQGCHGFWDSGVSKEKRESERKLECKKKCKSLNLFVIS